MAVGAACAFLHCSVFGFFSHLVFLRVFAPPPLSQDPLSQGRSDRAISSRLDLEPDAGARDAYGGIDAKVTAASLQLATWARSGPTADDQAPFAWTAAQNWSDAIHPGQPDCFDFAFQAFALARELAPDSPAVRPTEPPSLRAQSLPFIMTWLPDALMAALALLAVAACAAFCRRWRADDSASADSSSVGVGVGGVGDGDGSRRSSERGSGSGRVIAMLDGIELETPAYAVVRQHEEAL